jgi:predicted SnoaL-like aldol condensation-catalyzing enzyme
MALNQHMPREAVAQYVGEQYTQHNPGAPDGPEAFITFFDGFFATTPTFKVEVKRVIAEGDLVVIHSHAKRDDNDRGSAVVDIFRVADGKVVEHWDVIQPVPENPANTNTMF